MLKVLKSNRFLLKSKQFFDKQPSQIKILPYVAGYAFGSITLMGLAYPILPKSKNYYTGNLSDVEKSSYMGLFLASGIITFGCILLC